MMKIIIMTEHIEAKIMSRILMKRRLSKDRLRQNETLGNEKSMVQEERIEKFNITHDNEKTKNIEIKGQSKANSE